MNARKIFSFDFDDGYKEEEKGSGLIDGKETVAE